jgi:gliding motility-associated-like protein
MRLKYFLQTAAVLLFLLTGLRSSSQVCAGSLGDPVVNVDFGYSPNPASALQAATTSYFFTSSECPSDGSYTVVSSSAGCFNNTWHGLSEDHTPGDQTGYMMLVNASYQPGDFYVDTVKGLCANTTYEFAAWIVNVLRPSACDGAGIQPKLVFNIETATGTILGTYSTNNIAASSSPEWKQYGLFFTTPVNTNDVVIRITNTAPGGCGNDLALDDITFRPCGPSVTSSLPNTTETELHLCKGMATTIPVTGSISTGYINPAAQWQESVNGGVSWTDLPGETSLYYLFTRTATGIYSYRLAVADGTNIGLGNCRVASNIVTITIHDFPVITATSNSPVCEKTAINLQATGGSSYSWTGPAGFTAATANPSLVAGPSSAGLYQVDGTDEFGCKNSGSTMVLTNPKPLATTNNDQTLCEGVSINLSAGGGGSYLWGPATGLSAINIPNPVASPADTTEYMVVVTGANDCRDTARVTLNVLKKPVANAGPDLVILKGQQIVLNGVAGGSDIHLSWTPPTYLSDPKLVQPVATPASDIRYSLEVVSDAGCGTARDDVFVKVYNDVYVPSAFTPNGDGLNDNWRIDGLLAAPNARLLVYNRFGQLVFESVGNSRIWDGTFKGQPVSTGAYAYMLDLKNGLPVRKGTVVIAR